MTHPSTIRFGRILSLSLVLFAAGAFAAGTTIQTGSSDEYGRYITDDSGNSLYLFEADEDAPDGSACYKSCASVWPPVTTDGPPQAGEGVDAERLGTVERKDGTLQVTYGGHPLYRFTNDEQAGDTAGQDVEGFGAEWYLVGADGDKVGHEEEGEEEDEESGY